MISDLIYKELIEEITPEESRVLKKWLEEPANRALYDRIKQKTAWAGGCANMWMSIRRKTFAARCPRLRPSLPAGDCAMPCMPRRSCRCWSR